MTRYYDIVLGLIPVALVGISVALVFVGLPTVTAVPVGATVASILIGHAMFVNGPLEETDHASAGSQSTSQRGPINAD